MKSKGAEKQILDREKQFHDGWATDSHGESAEQCMADFVAPLAVEQHFILDQIGDVRGKKILDLGAGLGEAALYFASQKAEVTALDPSPEMLNRLGEIARKSALTVHTVVGHGASIPLPDGTFDVIYAGNVWHHVPNRQPFLQEMHRVLKPGGLFCSVDPIAYNPVIGVYRWLATKVRTQDEAPLKAEDLGFAKQYFEPRARAFFWLLSLSLFLKYFLVDRIHPNQERYWKKILREPKGTTRWVLALHKLDRRLLRLPLLQWLAWNVVFIGRKK